MAPLTPALFFDDAPCGLLVAERDGRIVRANRTFCQWVGKSGSEIEKTTRFQDLLTMGGRIFHQTHLLPLLQIQGSVSEVKLDLLVAGGGTVPIMVNITRQEMDGDSVLLFAVFVAKERDAYERELMASRRHAEALAEQHRQAQSELLDAHRRKDEFLAMLAHELRNPLAPIATSATLLKMVATDEAQVRHAAEVIERQIRHLTNLVDDLLDVSRVTRGVIALDLRDVSLTQVVEAALEQAKPVLQGRNHTIAVDLRHACVVNGDRTRLVQVVVNVLNNAAKYTPPGGRIEITVQRDGPHARIDVADNGVGIDADLLPRIFDLFSQAERTPDRSQGGLGIGLALVRSLVVLHGGSVEVRSDGPGRGAVFTLRLPLVEAGLPTAPAPIITPAITGEPIHVLVVDDNPDALSTLADVLRVAGHRVATASTAEEALGYLQGLPQPPHLCILDIGLPGMSGYELATRIRACAGDRAPVCVALTGYGHPGDVSRSREAGFDHHLVKPVDPAQLLRLVGTSRNPARIA